MRVLLVEDDAMIGQAIIVALQDAAYAIEWVLDGKRALSMAMTEPFDLVLLDLGLPFRDGLDVLRSLRNVHNDVPVLIITARDALENRVLGLDSGADDYLTKPFADGELLARMRALLRRRFGASSPEMDNGHFSLDPATKRVTQDGRIHALSQREFALLRALMVRPGAVLSRADLEDRIYGSTTGIESNVVEYIIHGLRQKLGAHAIRNVRGMGWMVDRAR